MNMSKTSMFFNYITREITIHRLCGLFEVDKEIRNRKCLGLRTKWDRTKGAAFVFIKSRTL